KELLIIGPPGLEEFIKVSGPHLFTGLDFRFTVKEVRPLKEFSVGQLKLVPYEACHRISDAYGLAVMTSEGVKVGFSGDTAEPCETLLQGLNGVEVLVHEATCDEEHSEVCRTYGHSTNFDAAHAAERLSSQALILYHIDEFFNSGLREEAEEIKARYTFKLYIPSDGEWISFT
ncbi:MAG: hypothetical protein J7L55_00115, partial [Desulfurococcales archaeon]|nr:hypothetical protein [Desulfurococcales archaeon]